MIFKPKQTKNATKVPINEFFINKNVVPAIKYTHPIRPSIPHQ